MTSTINCVTNSRVHEAFTASSRVVLPTPLGVTAADPQRPRLVNHLGNSAVPLPEIVDKTVQLLNGWPKVMDGTLMVPSGGDGLKELTSPASLFAYLSGVADSHWKKGANLATKEEYFQRMIQQCEQYGHVELYPHHRHTPQTLYHHRDIPAAHPGKLDELLANFSPATPEDASLLRAFVCTLFWGGTAGSRPLFVFANDSRDRNDRGRGIAKSTVVSVLSNLCGGLIDADSNTDIGKLETRLLSAGARNKRIVRIDNVKSERLSSAGLERLITATIISGHRMYTGEGTRPNYLTFTMTMNGVSVSEDLASRSVVIEFTRPQYQPTWQRDVQDFIERHRWEIIAEIIGILNGPMPNSLQGYQRHAEWEADVLARQPNSQRLLNLLQERRGDVDGDAETVRAIVDQLRQYFCNSGRTSNQIDVSTMVELVNAATGVRYPGNKIGRFLDRLGIAGLTHNRNNRGAFFLWNASVAVAPSTATILSH